VRAFVYDVQFLDGNLVDLVQNINAGHVNSVSFDNVDELVNCRVASDVHVGIRKSVFMANCFDCVIAHVSEFEAKRFYHVETAFFLSFNNDVWWSLVESDAEALQLILDLSSMRQWLHNIQNNQDACACSRHTNYLSTSSFTIFSAFDNTW